MIKKQIAVLSVLGISLLAGCNFEGAGEDIYEENGNTINVRDSEELYQPNTNKDPINNGYVRHVKSPVPDDNSKLNKAAGLNREQFADLIGRLAVQIPNVNDVGTLVTDEEVLIAYETTAENREYAAEQVRRTAESVVPRYYHIYVSDNPSLIPDIERFASTGPSAGSHAVDSTIKEMLKSPQGSAKVDRNIENSGTDQVYDNAENDTIQNVNNNKNNRSNANDEIDYKTQ